MIINDHNNSFSTEQSLLLMQTIVLINFQLSECIEQTIQANAEAGSELCLGFVLLINTLIQPLKSALTRT